MRVRVYPSMTYVRFTDGKKELQGPVPMSRVPLAGEEIVIGGAVFTITGPPRTEPMELIGKPYGCCVPVARKQRKREEIRE